MFSIDTLSPVNYHGYTYSGVACQSLSTPHYRSKKGRGSAEAEKSRKKLEKLFLTIPAWKVGDPAVPMCKLPEFPLLETPKDMGLDQILHSY